AFGSEEWYGMVGRRSDGGNEDEVLDAGLARGFDEVLVAHDIHVLDRVVVLLRCRRVRDHDACARECPLECSRLGEVSVDDGYARLLQRGVIRCRTYERANVLTSLPQPFHDPAAQAPGRSRNDDHDGLPVRVVPTQTPHMQSSTETRAAPASAHFQLPRPADPPEMRVLECSRVLEPVPECAIQPDMREPDERNH